MKNCGYCGRENPDEAVQCQECGTAFYFGKQLDSLKPSEEDDSLLEFIGQPISPWVKWGLYFAAWAAVILATLARNPANLLTATGFPIGLIAMLPNGAEKAILAAWMLGPISIGVGWTIYAMLSIIMGYTKKTSIFHWFIFCFAFCLH